ncbi:hypothetical protein GGR57DRAFT_497228 [Xylariaceae sp. FL1272]|nr:hypothetical protein GGR57DRAFT_497228 [Xylariaceae sp. FL1272]
MYALALTSLLTLAAAAPAASTSGATCSSTSTNRFRWTIDDFTYHAGYLFTTPAHQVSSGSVAFNLTNTAVDETVSCTAYSTQLEDFFYGNFNYNCTASDESTTVTSFAFSRPTGQLNINQTWTCDEGSDPVQFIGVGAANLTLDCTESNYQNPDWQLGETYSDRVIDCEPVSITLKPSQITGIA